MFHPSRGAWSHRVSAVLAVIVLFAGCVGPTPIEKDSIIASVTAVLAAQVAAWNAGDIERFMQTYWQSDDLCFASGGTVNRGWEATLERYRTTYPDRAAMGQLTFDLLDVQVLAEDAAVVFGSWRLRRAGEDLSGLYTLVIRKLDGRWLIVHDHTSVAPRTETSDR